MQYAHILISALALVVALAAMVMAVAPRKTDGAVRLRRLEIEQIEQGDLIDHLSVTLKKLHGRAASRQAQAAHVPNPNDPMERLPGESGEAWKARMGRTIAGATSTRRN